jgi:hypothetical protein
MSEPYVLRKSRYTDIMICKPNSNPNSFTGIEFRCAGCPLVGRVVQNRELTLAPLPTGKPIKECALGEMLRTPRGISARPRELASLTFRR